MTQWPVSRLVGEETSSQMYLFFSPRCCKQKNTTPQLKHVQGNNSCLKKNTSGGSESDAWRLETHLPVSSGGERRRMTAAVEPKKFCLIRVWGALPQKQ